MRLQRRFPGATECALDGHMVDRIGLAIYGRELEDVAQLTHIAGPTVTTQALDGPGCEAAPAYLCPHLRQEVLREWQNVARARPKRWKLEDQSMDPIEEIGAEASALDLGTQVTVGSAHQAYVDAPLTLPAESAYAPGLEDPEQTRLKIEWELRDFIEEQRSFVRLLEGATVSVGRSGKRTPFVTKELALDELARKAASVERNERTAAPRASFVKSARNVLLAHAGFTAN